MYNFGGNLFTILILLTNSFLIARFLIGEDFVHYATFYFSLGIITYLSIIAGDGFNSTLVTDSRTHKEENKQKSFLHNYWRIFNIICLVSGSINIIISMIYYFAQNKLDIGITLLILTPTLASIALYKFSNSIFQIKKIMKWDFVAKLIALSVRLLGFLMIIFFDILRNPYYLASIYSCSWIIQSLTTFIPSFKLAKLSFKELFSSWKLKFVNFKKSLLFLLYFIVNGNIITLGYILLEHFSNEIELSFFAASLLLSNLLLIFTGSMSVVLFSEASDVESTSYNKKLLNTTLFTIMLLYIVSIPLITFSDLFYYLYNPLFISATKQTGILISAFLVNSIIQILLIPLLHYGKTIKLIAAFSVGFIFEIIMVIFSVKYGSLGISFVIFFTYLIILILIIYFNTQILEVKQTVIRTAVILFFSSCLLALRLILPVTFRIGGILFATFFVVSISLLFILMSKDEKSAIKDQLRKILFSKSSQNMNNREKSNKRKIKIAMIRNTDHPINVSFVSGLKEGNFDITLFVPKGQKTKNLSWIKEFKFVGNFYYSFPIKFQKMLKQFDVIISSDIFFPATIRLYLYCKIRSKTLLVISEKYFYSRKHLNSVLLKIFYKIIGSIILNDTSTVINCAHTYKAMRFLDMNNVKKFHYLPPLVDFNKSISSRTKFDDDIIRLISISRHIYARDIRSVISSYNVLSKKYKEKIELTIIGDGKEFNNNYLYSKNLGLDINFIKYMPHKEILKQLKKYDIYIQPARIEATGIAVLEAMATGLVIVSTKVGGLYDLVITDLTLYNKDGMVINKSIKQDFAINGVLYVKQSKPEFYITSIESILESYNKNEIRKIGMNAYKNSKNKHHRDVVCSIFLRILQNYFPQFSEDKK